MFGSVLVGFGMAGGAFGVLIQPSELVVIGGATIGTVIISAPGKVLSRVTGALKKGFKSAAPAKSEGDRIKARCRSGHRSGAACSPTS